MNLLSFVIIPLIAFLLAIFDVSFFSFYELFGATVISSFCTLMVLSVLGRRKEAVLFAACSILFLSAFSSLSLFILMLVFLGIPLLIFYARDKIFFETSFSPAVIVFLSSTFIFRLLLSSMNFEADSAEYLSIIVFPIINTLFCIIVFVLLKKLDPSRKKF